MYPILLKYGRFELRSYGLMLAFAFLAGVWLACRRAGKRGMDAGEIMNLSVIVLICAIVGSRFFYVVTHLDEFRGHWPDTVNPVQSSGAFGIAGLSMLGGVVFSLAGIILYCLLQKIPFLRLLDVIAPPFALGLGIGRIGCFLNGCCFGKPCNLPWCMAFPSDSPAGFVFQNAAIHPTQAYSSLFGFALFAALIFLDRKKRPDGFLLSVFMIFYGTFRFLVDYLRYYESSVQVHCLGTVFTINQIIVLILFTCGVALLAFVLKKGCSSEG